MEDHAHPTQPRVGVVTVSYASEAVLPAFLESIGRASSHPVCIVVADNKPTESGAVARLAERAKAVYLPLPENRGYGYAANRAVAAMPPSVEWVLVSNPDVVLGPQAIDLLVSAGDEDDRIGAVGPAIATPDGDLYPSARRIPSLSSGIGHALLGTVWPENAWTRAYLGDRNGEPRDAEWLSGACVLVRRAAFEAVSGFDEGYFMYFEDVDLGFRLGRAGFRNAYRPTARAVHVGGHSTGTVSARMLAEHHRSAMRFLAARYPGPLYLPLRALLRLGLAARAAVAVRRAR